MDTVRTSAFDPEVHRVEAREPRPLALLAHVALEIGLDVGQEERLRVDRALRELRLEVGEDVELGVEGVADVEVPLVLTRVEEGLASLDVLDVLGVHLVAAQHLVLALGEVVAHRPHHADVAEVGRGEREVHGGAAEGALALPKGGLDRVKGDRTDDDEAHGLGQASRCV